MKLYKVKLLLACVPFPFEYTVTVSDIAKAQQKAKEEIKRRYNLITGNVIEQEILSTMEINRSN